MSRIVHVRPVAERTSPHLGSPVVSGRDVERREQALRAARDSGDVVTDVPTDGQDHRFWPSVCTRCNSRE